jgi:Zn-dependent peptidase ImmA (M78 family)
MANRLTDLAMQALVQATQIRQSAGLGLTDPVNIYDLAKQRGVEVRFVDIPSLEGMYVKLNQRSEIFISAHRPPGRQAATCGHELGHHEFMHGTQIDEYLDGAGEVERFDPREFLVDCFSGFVLMPKSAVNYAFTIRGWQPQSCTATQAYRIAGLFGVGYITLLQHMSKTLKLIPQAQAQQLKRTSPKQIRAMLLGGMSTEQVTVVDLHWPNHAVDIQVGDLILAPPEVICEGNCTEQVEQSATRTIFRGSTPGRARLVHPPTGWAAFTRVSRRQYVGRSIFRHLEEADDE